jgi:hypothetical protein
MSKWEYRVEGISSDRDADIQKAINEKGKEDWEAFAAVLQGSVYFHVFFKRRLED